MSRERAEAGLHVSDRIEPEPCRDDWHPAASLAESAVAQRRADRLTQSGAAPAELEPRGDAKRGAEPRAGQPPALRCAFRLPGHHLEELRLEVVTGHAERAAQGLRLAGEGEMR